jgi:hypothetical protein
MTIYLTGHFDRPHFHAFQCDCWRLEWKHETVMYRNKFLIICFTVSVSVSINDRSTELKSSWPLILKGDLSPIILSSVYHTYLRPWSRDGNSIWTWEPSFQKVLGDLNFCTNLHRHFLMFDSQILKFTLIEYLNCQIPDYWNVWIPTVINLLTRYLNYSGTVQNDNIHIACSNNLFSIL